MRKSRRSSIMVLPAGGPDSALLHIQERVIYNPFGLMHLSLRPRKPHRFERFNLVLAILLAGWVPSVLTLVVSYTILRNTLESKILRDRQTFVQLIGHLVGDDLSRTGGIIEYYQTLPDTVRLLATPNGQGAAQQWLATAFYSHPRIDSMFMTGPDGRLVASVPAEPDLIGKDY